MEKVRKKTLSGFRVRGFRKSPRQQKESSSLNETGYYSNVNNDQQKPLFKLVLPGQKSKYNNYLVVKKSLLQKAKRWTFRLTSAAMIVTILIGGLIIGYSYMNIHKVLKGSTTPLAVVKSLTEQDQLKGQGRVNVLLLGRSGGNTAKSDLTDSITIASLDPVNKNITLISIPMNLWVSVPGHGAMTINSVWQNGVTNFLHTKSIGTNNPDAIKAGYSEVDQTISSSLGVNIDYNVIANETAFKQFINSINGVPIYVPVSLSDSSLAKTNGWNSLISQKGWMTLTGNQALNYSRSKRQVSTSTIYTRQRSILVALKQKVITLGIVTDAQKLAQLISTLGDNISTDLNLNDAYGIFGLISNINQDQITSAGLLEPDQNYLTQTYISGQAVEVPSAGQFNYTAIQSYIRSQIPDRSLTKENAHVELLNGSTNSGLISNISDNLKSSGYNIIGTYNAPSNKYGQTMLIDLSKGKDPYTAKSLEKRFNTTSLNSLPDNSIQTNGADFVIILGNDETVNSQG